MTPAKTPQEHASRTEDEQLAAARTLLNLEAGADIVGPLKSLITECDLCHAKVAFVKQVLRTIGG